MDVILQTPSILPIIPFDPANEYNIEFVYQDVQPVKNRAVITDNESGNVVYDSVQNTMRLYHTLPSGTLTAGKKYLIQIQVFDVDNNYSNLSDAVLFLCLTTPEFSFNNLTSGTVYKQANIALELLYSQLEGEQIRNYQIVQYNAEKVKIGASEVIYSQDNLTYTFYGLENNNTYYFRAIGETQNEMPLDTGYIEVNVQLTLLPIDAIFQLDNDYNEGVIRLTFDIRDVHYTLTGDDYTFSNGAVTLNTSSVLYDSGFSVNDNFALFCQVNKVPLGTFLSMEDEMVVLSVLKICDSYYFELKIKDSDFRQYVKLENTTLTNDGKILIGSENTYVTARIRRVNGYYGLDLV